MGMDALTQLQIVDGFLAWDLWQGRDLVSHLRLRAGPGVEVALWKDHEDAIPVVTAAAALEGRFMLDGSGLHHLGFGHLGVGQ